MCVLNALGKEREKKGTKRDFFSGYQVAKLLTLLIDRRRRDASRMSHHENLPLHNSFSPTSSLLITFDSCTLPSYTLSSISARFLVRWRKSSSMAGSRSRTWHPLPSSFVPLRILFQRIVPRCSARCELRQ